jgi:hypothetical protein
MAAVLVQTLNRVLVMSIVTAFVSASIRASSLVWNGCSAGPNLKQSTGNEYSHSFRFRKQQSKFFCMEWLQCWSKP